MSAQLDFSWRVGDLMTVLPVMLLTFFFLLYWFTAQSDLVKAWFYRRYQSDKASVYYITSGRVFGFLTLGVLPGIISLILMPRYALHDFGLTFRPATALFSLLWILGLGTVMATVVYRNASKPENLAQYPQIRAKGWTRQTVILNVMGWALYLLGYEFLFRGILLFPLAAHLGVWPAIAINVAIYALIHIPKGVKETLGAIPLGLVLCLLTLASGTIWIAFFVHLTMALTNSFASLKFHPDMVYVKSSE